MPVANSRAGCRLPAESEIRKLAALPTASHNRIRQRARGESGKRGDHQQSAEGLHQYREDELSQNHQQNENSDAHQQPQLIRINCGVDGAFIADALAGAAG